jgi:sortase A
MLAYCAFVLVDTWVFQKEQHRQFEKLLQDRQQANSRAIQPSYPTPAQDLPPGLTERLIGRIEVPRFGISVYVIEGTSSSTLRRAVGHISGTALPGNPGNVGISGHRDTFFRPLRNIRRNDIITLTTLLGEYRYRVVSTRIVNPYDVGVLDQSEDEILTLVTCYPFYFVGSAPNRFIVRAERVGGDSTQRALMGREGGEE